MAVIGGGPGGYVAAIRASQRGLKTCLVEKEKLGGVCLNKGCIPTKTLIYSVHVLELIRRAEEFGVTVEGEVRVEMEKLMARKQKVVEGLVKGVGALLKSNKVDVYEGQGKLAGRGLLSVKDSSGAEQTIEVEKVIIATGSRPAQLPSLPLDGSSVLSSDDALELSEVPGEMLIVGAGVIGCEMACLYNSLGSTITMVELLPRCVPLEDEEISALMARELKKKKIKLIVGDSVTSVRQEQGGRVTAVLDKGGDITVDKILVSVGRAFNVEDLGLEDLGVEQGPRGHIVVNEKMQTNVPGVYAIGDVIGGYMLAHAASAEGIVAADNAAGIDRMMDYNAVPGAVFTDPEIASVGLSEQEAAERDYKVRIGRFPYRALGKAQVLGEIAGMVKLVADEETDRLLGAHIIGAQATNVIHEMVIALNKKATLTEVAETIHAHPTIPEAVMEAAHDAYGMAIHVPRPLKKT